MIIILGSICVRNLWSLCRRNGPGIKRDVLFQTSRSPNGRIIAVELTLWHCAINSSQKLTPKQVCRLTSTQIALTAACQCHQANSEREEASLNIQRTVNVKYRLYSQSISRNIPLIRSLIWFSFQSFARLALVLLRAFSITQVVWRWRPWKGREHVIKDGAWQTEWRQADDMPQIYDL